MDCWKGVAIGKKVIVVCADNFFFTVAVIVSCKFLSCEIATPHCIAFMIYNITCQITFNLFYKLFRWQSEQSYCRQLIPHHWRLCKRTCTIIALISKHFTTRGGQTPQWTLRCPRWTYEIWWPQTVKVNLVYWTVFEKPSPVYRVFTST